MANMEGVSSPTGVRLSSTRATDSTIKLYRGGRYVNSSKPLVMDSTIVDLCLVSRIKLFSEFWPTLTRFRE